VESQCSGVSPIFSVYHVKYAVFVDDFELQYVGREGGNHGKFCSEEEID
jgi:hypothetical protein